MEKNQKQLLKECFSAWKQTDAAYSELARSRNFSLNTIWVFEYLSEHPEGTEPAVLADATNMLRQTVTVVLNDLEVRQLICREFHPTDRRKKLIKLTTEGQKVCSEILDTIADAELAALTGFSAEDQRQLFKLTSLFCQALIDKLVTAAR